MAGLFLLLAAVIFGITGANGQKPAWTSEEDIYVCDNATSKVIHTLTADDAHSYWIENEENVPFAMCDGSGATPNYNTDGEVCITERLDYETVKSYDLIVVASEELFPTSITVGVSQELTVNLIDVNDNAPQFKGLPYVYNVLEGNTTGKIFVLKADDQDDGYGKVIDFFLEENDDGVFGISNASQSDEGYWANLTLKINLDYEESEIHIVVAVAQDRGSSSSTCGFFDPLSSSTNIFLNVLDAPDTPPRFTKVEYRSSVQENTTTITGDSMIKARDGDYGLNWDINYSLHGGSDIFNITNDGEILVIGNVDRESKEVISNGGFYTLTVTATEVEGKNSDEFAAFPGAQSTNVTVIMVVEDVNDFTPTFYKTSNYEDAVTEYTNISMPENTLNSVSDFSIYVKDFDQGDNAKFKLTLEGEDAQYFSINPDGEVSEAQAILNVRDVSGLDYEVRKQLKFKVVAAESQTAERHNQTVMVTIDLTDTNDNFPVFDSDNYEETVPEDAEPGSNVTSVRATDKDSGTFGQVTYSLSPNDVFDIHDDGTVYLKGKLDREMREEYYVTVRAEDGNNLINTTQLKITIDDINDEAPSFQQNQYSTNWNEEDMDVTEVTVYALDRDKEGTVNSNITYQFEDPSLLTNYSILTTSEGYGVIRPIGSLDAEATEDECGENGGVIQYDLVVLAVDGGTPTKNASVSVSIYLQDINDFKPVFAEAVYNATIPEEAERDTAVANISATDGDKCSPNNDITYAVHSDFSDKFSMQQSKDGIGTLVVRNSQLDRDDIPMYNVTVLAVDSGQPSQTGTSTVKVTIADINNKSPFFNGTNPRTAEVNENATIGDVVVTVIAEDPDADPDLRYSIDSFTCTDENQASVIGNECDSTFNITTKDQKGQIIVLSKLDREKVEKVGLVIKVEDVNRDEKSELQTATWSIEITLLDYNDNAPKFSESLYNFAVSEEADSDTLIDQVYVSDDDVGENSKVVLSVESPFVKIDENGQLRVKGRIDREGDPGDNFTAIVYATDTGAPNLTGNCTVFFSVMDTNDNTPTFNNQTDFNCSVKEEEGTGERVCDVTATDSDIGNNGEVIYVLSPTTDFFIDRTSGTITTRKSFDREAKDKYEVKVTAEDNAGDLSRKAEVSVTIAIKDIDDVAPTYNGMTQSMSIAEDATTGTIVGTVAKANDTDTEEFQNNFYFLVYKNTDNDRMFSLDKSTRVLKTTGELDREKNATYNLIVLATEEEDFVMSDEYDEDRILRLQVSIVDVNDNSPKFTKDIYTADLQFDTQPSEVNVVAVVDAEDPDEGDNSVLVYEIIKQEYTLAGGTTQNVFDIKTVEGQGHVTLVGALNPEIGGRYILTVRVADVPGRNDTATININIVVLDETIILTSTFTPEYLNDHREDLESELEDILNADVTIDSILAHGTAIDNSQAKADDGDAPATEPKSDIYFHATSWNSTEVIPAEEVIDTLDNIANTQFLARYGIISVSTGDEVVDDNLTELDLLKAVLVVVCCLLFVIVVVYTTAFVCMRKSYRRKIKVATATEDAAREIIGMESSGAPGVPGARKFPDGQNPLYLENEKGNIDYDQWLRSQESNDDDNSIDDNEVDGQDSVNSADDRPVELYMDMNNDDDLSYAEIDFDENTANDDAANLEAALNAARRNKGTEDIVLMFDNPAMEQTAM